MLIELKIDGVEYEVKPKVDIVLPREGSGLRWPMTSLKYYIDWNSDLRLAPIRRSLARQLIAAQARKISAVCALDLRETRVRRLANFTMGATKVDGKGNTLAFVNLPVNSEFIDVCRGCGSVVYDIADLGNPNDFGNVTLHELSHSVGVGHSNVVNSVMYPRANLESKLVKELDPWTINELRTRYPIV